MSLTCLPNNYHLSVREEQQKETFRKHHANLKEKKVSDLQEKLEARRRGLKITPAHYEKHFSLYMCNHHKLSTAERERLKIETPGVTQIPNVVCI